MVFYRVPLCLLVLSVVQCFSTPVFIWGNLPKTPFKSNPLTEVSSEEFQDLLVDLLEKNPFVVVFNEETLSVEDFSRKNTFGQTSFKFLKANVHDALYLPSVNDSLTVIENVADPEKVDYVKLTEKALTAEIKPESGRFLIISLRDAHESESRVELLERHDGFMEDLFKKLQAKYDKVVGIYTGHYPSWTVTETHSRVRRQAQSGSMPYSLDYLLLSVNKFILNVKGQVTILSDATSASSSLNETALTVDATLKFTDNELVLSFYSRGGYWFFEKVTLTQTAPDSFTEDLLPAEEVYALNDFSYRCGQDIIFRTVNQSQAANLTISGFHIQPFFNNLTNATSHEFGDPFYCVGFFSAPIWSGLFVVFFMLLITFYGIMMMLDIRTNDRFDDPKGKTITINAGE